MFEVGSETLNMQLTWLAAAIVLLALISLVPWGRTSRPGRLLTSLPLVALPLYYFYEAAMPNNFNIRIDLFVIWPALVLIVMLWLGKMGWRGRKKE